MSSISLVDEHRPRKHIYLDETPSAGHGYRQRRLGVIAHMFTPIGMVTASRTSTTARRIGYMPQGWRLFPSEVAERHPVMVSGSIVAEMFPYEIINNPDAQQCLLDVDSFETASS